MNSKSKQMAFHRCALRYVSLGYAAGWRCRHSVGTGAPWQWWPLPHPASRLLSFFPPATHSYSPAPSEEEASSYFHTNGDKSEKHLYTLQDPLAYTRKRRHKKHHMEGSLYLLLS